MQFWKGNREDADFSMPVAEVAQKFCAWFRAEPGADDVSRDGLPLERVLRWWLCAREHFNASWEAEHGAEAFDSVWNLVYAEIYPPRVTR